MRRNLFRQRLFIIKDDTLFVVTYTRNSGSFIALRRFYKSGQQIIPIDKDWTHAYQKASSFWGEYAVLRVKESIPAVLSGGTETTLLPDTYLIMTSCDEKSYVRFLTEQGV